MIGKGMRWIWLEMSNSYKNEICRNDNKSFIYNKI